MIFPMMAVLFKIECNWRGQGAVFRDAHATAFASGAEMADVGGALRRWDVREVRFRFVAEAVLASWSGVFTLRAMKTFPTFSLFAIALALFRISAHAQNLAPNPSVLRTEGIQSDFPALALDAKGQPWIAYVGWDGTQDTLRIAQQTGGALAQALMIGKPGIIHQPALATDGSGALVVVWSQVNGKDVMDLHAQRVRDGKPEGDIITLAASANGGNAFAKAATDRAGRVWVAWQGMRGGLGRIFCRVFDPAKGAWSKEVQVTGEPGGDWEPCVAFDGNDGAWICYDSSRGNEFNIYANHVAPDGTVGETKTIIHTPRYEGRVSAIGAADGKGIWVACERGRMKWGLDIRAHGHTDGLNGQKNMVLAFWDPASGKVEEAPDIEMLLEELPAPPPIARRTNAPPNAKAKAKQDEKNEAKPDGSKLDEAVKAANKTKAAQLAGSVDRLRPHVRTVVLEELAELGDHLFFLGRFQGFSVRPGEPHQFLLNEFRVRGAFGNQPEFAGRGVDLRVGRHRRFRPPHRIPHHRTDGEGDERQRPQEQAAQD